MDKKEETSIIHTFIFTKTVVPFCSAVCQSRFCPHTQASRSPQNRTTFTLKIKQPLTKLVPNR